MKPLDFQDALRWARSGPHPRERGRVLWFTAAEGAGRIRADVDGEELFVHFSAIRGEGHRQLDDGQRVEFDRQPGPAGWRAEDVVALPDPASEPTRDGLA